MELNRRTLAIGGFVLIAILVVAGIVFSPSGFVPANKGYSGGLACYTFGTHDLCEGSPATDYWKTNTFRNNDFCEAAFDENDHRCTFKQLCFCDYIGE
jgi:hypothetical protein